MILKFGNNRVALKAKGLHFMLVKMKASRHNVKVLADDSAMGNAVGSGTYDDGKYAYISAIPAYGYKFSHWSDGNTSSIRQILVARDITLIAYFEEGASNIGALTYIPNQVYFDTSIFQSNN